MQFLSKITKLTVAVALANLTASCTAIAVDNSPNCKSTFLELVRTGQVTSVNGLAISPNYKAFYFTERFDGKARLSKRNCESGHWQKNTLVFENHAFQDYQPTLSRDGNRLYFTSTRPISGNEPARQNVWVAVKSDEWGHPLLIKELASPSWDGHAVEITPSTLLFASDRAESDSMVDAYQIDLSAATPRIVLVTALNTQSSDNDFGYDYHSQMLVFSRYDPDTKDIDLFVSFHTDANWTIPVPLAALNSTDWEMSPAFTPDGQYLLFKRADKPFQLYPALRLQALYPQM